MYKWVQNTFALSEEGSRTFVRGVVWTFLHFISLMFPMMMLFYFLMEQMGIGEFAGKTPHGTLFYVGIAAVLFIVMLVIYRFSYSATYSSVYDESMRRRVSIAEKLRKLPLSFFGKKNLSDLTSTIMDDCNALEMIFSHAVPELFAAIGSVTIIGIMLFCYNWKMSIALFWVVPAAALLIALSKKIQDRWFENSYNMRREIMEDIQEGLENVQEIRSYSGEAAYLNHFDKDCINYEKSQMDSDVKVGSFLNSAQGILKMGLATVLITGARLWTKGEIDVFTYLVFIVCAATVYNPVYLVFNNLAELFFVNVRLRRFREMDQMKPQEGVTEFVPQNYDIEFKDVDFNYNENKQVLKKVSFTAKQGEITALVGPSGSGKTTAAKLAARFWDIQGGTVTLGGQDISKIDPETLLKNFSIVFQDVVLFNTSIKDNIRIGKRDASDEEILKVAKLAGCDEFVQKMPQGYDTVIGENGDTLSGGERQRISIARALLKDAPIILLDEATASLDVENESKIQRGISQLVKGKTVIIIAHRMRTIANADKVVVLQDGHIAETGSPAELKAKGGLFSKMLKLQEVSNA
ncbi:ABC transporter ATP-binding protein [uncultured Fibrobacter sp.]|uniref:ABC transporter ATP-binding protein n=1 Tax=uncultured Fibrobacter sp. TaxID=261512 RepID=UPI0025EAFE6E|nr:ABC transporter ATP-binding protein [uncultured Fibrobacter sp.]